MSMFLDIILYFLVGSLFYSVYMLLIYAIHWLFSGRRFK